VGKHIKISCRNIFRAKDDFPGTSSGLSRYCVQTQAVASHFLWENISYGDGSKPEKPYDWRNKHPEIPRVFEGTECVPGF